MQSSLNGPTERFIALEWFWFAAIYMLLLLVGIGTRAFTYSQYCSLTHKFQNYMLCHLARGVITMRESLPHCFDLSDDVISNTRFQCLNAPYPPQSYFWRIFPSGQGDFHSLTWSSNKMYWSCPKLLTKLSLSNSKIWLTWQFCIWQNKSFEVFDIRFSMRAIYVSYTLTFSNGIGDDDCSTRRSWRWCTTSGLKHRVWNHAKTKHRNFLDDQ